MSNNKKIGTLSIPKRFYLNFSENSARKIFFFCNKCVKITLNNEVYYIKEDCKEIQKGNKQAKITDEDLNTINNIISNILENESNNITNTLSNNNIPVNEVIRIE